MFSFPAVIDRLGRLFIYARTKSYFPRILKYTFSDFTSGKPLIILCILVA